MYEHFEHTADLGLRIRAPSAEELFAEAARALTAALVASPGSIRPALCRSIELQAAERADLLHDWLAEILFLFEAERLLFGEFKVALRPDGLVAEVWGEPFDTARHRLQLEIKAITYHRLKLEPSPEGWLAEVIVDL